MRNLRGVCHCFVEAVLGDSQRLDDHRHLLSFPFEAEVGVIHTLARTKEDEDTVGGMLPACHCFCEAVAHAHRQPSETGCPPLVGSTKLAYGDNGR